MSNTSYKLQGGDGGRVLNSGEGEVSGGYKWLQMVEDTVFSNLESSNLENVIDLVGVTHLAGSGIGGNFDVIQVASGTCIAYK